MTRREREVASWFHDQIATTGVVPTYRDAAEQLGVGFSSVARIMRHLRDAGHINRSGGRNGRRVTLCITLPAKGLLASEIAWCQANPERVRAMIELTGSTVQ